MWGYMAGKWCGLAVLATTCCLITCFFSVCLYIWNSPFYIGIEQQWNQQYMTYTSTMTTLSAATVSELSNRLVFDTSQTLALSPQLAWKYWSWLGYWWEQTVITLCKQSTLDLLNLMQLQTPRYWLFTFLIIFNPNFWNNILLLRKILEIEKVHQDPNIANVIHV